MLGGTTASRAEREHSAHSASAGQAGDDRASCPASAGAGQARVRVLSSFASFREVALGFFELAYSGLKTWVINEQNELLKDEQRF